VGKAQLAFLSPAEIERLYPENNLGTLTDRTVKTRAALLEELKRTTERGWALENEEADVDVRGIAVPVRDFSLSVIAAIGIVAPSGRLGDEKLEKGGIISLLKESGKSLSLTLGFGGMNGNK
jgi:IclR family acetate operon transcriptional repressor